MKRFYVAIATRPPPITGIGRGSLTVYIENGKDRNTRYNRHKSDADSTLAIRLDLHTASP